MYLDTFIERASEAEHTGDQKGTLRARLGTACGSALVCQYLHGINQQLLPEGSSVHEAL